MYGRLPPVVSRASIVVYFFRVEQEHGCVDFREQGLLRVVDSNLGTCGHVAPALRQCPSTNDQFRPNGNGLPKTCVGAGSDSMQPLEVNCPAKRFVHQRKNNSAMQYSRPAGMIDMRGIQGAAAVKPILKEWDVQPAWILGTTNIAKPRFRIYAWL